MIPSRSVVLLLGVSLGMVGGPALRLSAEKAAGPATKQDEAIQLVQRLLDEQQIATNQSQKEMPLGEFLAALEKQLPEGKKVALGIDRQAFGKDAAAVARTPIHFPTTKMSLRRMLEQLIGKIKTKADYRLEPGAVLLTTPARALYTLRYDIHDLLKKPQFLMDQTRRSVPDNSPLRKVDSDQKAALLVEAIVSAIDPASWRRTTAHHGAIESVNGGKLVIRANAARHAEVTDLLQAYRRGADMVVTVEAKLYEVDQAFYTRLNNAPYVSREELERRADGRPEPKDSLFKLLEKQKPVLTGEKGTVEHGGEGLLLSRHKAVAYIPPPELKKPLAVLEGFSFGATVRVSPDRRWVELNISEKLTEIEEIKKIEVFALGGKEIKEVRAEQPVLREITHSQDVDVPDGGARLVAVHARPRALQARNRWWVLHIRPTIVIAEEEQAILQMTVKEDLPLLIADLLNNPRLKIAREFAGTPGDKRFALVDSDAWTWPKELRRSVSGYQLTPVQREGKRLLGIRVDRFQRSEKEDAGLDFTVTLVNAGGTANGEAFGGCTLHYAVRGAEKSRTIKLIDAFIGR
jgi:hypothetical protein